MKRPERQQNLSEQYDNKDTVPEKRYKYWLNFLGNTEEYFDGIRPSTYNPGTIIKLGDGSLWSYSNQYWSEEKGYTIYYVPSKVRDMSFLHPSK